MRLFAPPKRVNWMGMPFSLDFKEASAVSTPGGICQTVVMQPAIQQTVWMDNAIRQTVLMQPAIQQTAFMGCE